MNLTADYRVLPFGERDIHWSLSHNIKESIDASSLKDWCEIHRWRRITHSKGIRPWWPTPPSIFFFFHWTESTSLLSSHYAWAIPHFFPTSLVNKEEDITVKAKFSFHTTLCNLIPLHHSKFNKITVFGFSTSFFSFQSKKRDGNEAREW